MRNCFRVSVLFAAWTLIPQVLLAQTCVDPPTGLVSWWTGDSNASDRADGNPGALTNGALAGVSGWVDGAFRLDGVDDYVHVPSADNLKLGQQVTVDAWVKFEPTANLGAPSNWVVAKKGSATINYLLRVTDGRPNFYVVAGGLVVNATSSETVAPDMWYHVAGTYDGTSVRIYVDGAEKGSVAGSGTLATSDEILCIGGTSACGASPFLGLIDEMGIYSRALSGAEIQAIHAAGFAGKCRPEAATRHVFWVGPVNGDWSDGSKWSTGVPPGSADNAIIAVGGTYTVNLNVDASVRSLTLGGGSGTQSLRGDRTLSLGALSSIEPSGILALPGINGPGTLRVRGTLGLESSTINASVVNEGFIHATRFTSTLNGSFTLVASGTVRVQGLRSELRFATGFTNSGVIELFDNSDIGGGLRILNGSLVNIGQIRATGGGFDGGLDNRGSFTINAFPPHFTIDGGISLPGGPRPIVSSGLLTLNSGTLFFTNYSSCTNAASGTIDASGGNLTFDQSGGRTFTNDGTVALGPGRTLQVSGGTFIHNGVLTGGSGRSLVLTGVTASFAHDYSTAAAALNVVGAVLNGPGIITNAATTTLSSISTSVVNTGLVNEGTLLARDQRTTVNGSFTQAPGAVIRVQGLRSELAVANGFTNNGLIELFDNGDLGGGLRILNGSLVNAGQIRASGGGVDGGLDNRGTFTINAVPVTIDGGISLPGGARPIVNSGLVTLNSAPLVITNYSSYNNAASGTIDASGGNLTFNNFQTGSILTNDGAMTLGNGRTLTIAGGTLNHNGLLSGGSNRFFALDDATVNFAHDYSTATAVLNLAGPGLFALAGTTLNGPGVITNVAGTTLLMRRSRINAALVNQGTIHAAQFDSPINGAFTQAPGAVIRIQGFRSNLTFAHGFTNNGLIELFGDNSDLGGRLKMLSGVLVNAPTGEIRQTGGALNCGLDNRGMVNCTAGGGIDAGSGSNPLPGGFHPISNSGTIIETNGPLTIVGYSSVTNTASGAINVTGGNLTFLAPSFSPFVNDGTISAPGRQIVIGEGQLFGSGIFRAAAVTTTHVGISPGAPSVGAPGVLTIEGGLNLLLDSALDCDIVGPDPGTGYDQLVVSGFADLRQARLNVRRAPAFIPCPGTNYTILLYGSQTGQFAFGSTGLDLGGGRFLQPVFGLHALTLQVAGPTPPECSPCTITAPADATFECVGQVPSPSAGQATLSENCGARTISVTDADNGGSGSQSNPLIITRTYTATDAAGNTASATQTITVVDTTPPSLQVIDVTTLTDSAQCTAIVSFTPQAQDNCGVAEVACSPPSGTAFPIGTTTVRCTAIDVGDHAVRDSFTVTVQNPSPSVTITSPASGAVFAVNTPVNFTGTFTDNPSDVHTAQWALDLVPAPGPATVDEAAGTVSLTHTFTAAGVYKVSLTVRDQCGGAGTADHVGEFEALVVVYDPTAGFVTGGGWIQSPAGAYVPNPALSGKANFGFVSRYKRGATIPTGQTEFQFKVADLNFHSSTYEWLVIAGARAKYKGSGTINQAGDFRFMLTGIDGQLNGGGGVDKFRMKIWDPATDAIVYDNQLAADDDAPLTTALGGGSIVIHSDGTPVKPSEDVPAVPTQYALHDNVPDPFNPVTTLKFDLPEAAAVTLRVHDIRGRLVAVLAEKKSYPAGRHQVVFEARNLTSGIYFYTLQTARYTHTKKMVLIK